MTAPDVDTLNAVWSCAIRTGVVEPYAGEPDMWALTSHGHAVARTQARTLGLDPDSLSASELISLAVYGTPALGDPVV